MNAENHPADNRSEFRRLLNSLSKNDSKMILRSLSFLQYYEIPIKTFRTLIEKVQTKRQRLTDSDYQVLGDFLRWMGPLLPRDRERPLKNKDKND